MKIAVWTKTNSIIFRWVVSHMYLIFWICDTLKYSYLSNKRSPYVSFLTFFIQGCSLIRGATFINFHNFFQRTVFITPKIWDICMKTWLNWLLRWRAMFIEEALLINSWKNMLGYVYLGGYVYLRGEVPFAIWKPKYF